MENFPVNPLDLAVVAVALLAALLAFTRGLAAEVLSLAAWVGAAVVTMFALPHVLPIARNYIQFEMLAYGGAAAGVFIVALVILSILGGALSRRVQNSRLSAVDRSLGFAFGLAKGGVLASLAWLFVVWLLPPGEHPDWMRDAKTRPLLNMGASAIYELAPAHLRAEGLAQVDFARERAQQAIDAKQALDRLTSPTPTPTTPGGKTDAQPANNGYKERDRGEIDRLIQNTR